jgi:hypothetical protein
VDKDLLPPLERPSSLFKYCSPERADIVERLKIRFTQPVLFNDIFECFPGTDETTDFQRAYRNCAMHIARTVAANPKWSRKQRREFERVEARKFEKWCKSEMEKSHHERFCEEVQVRISATLSMLCLSGKWDNTLMWSHYTNDHRGFVIEFNGKDPFFDFGFEKVAYSNERPLFIDRPDGWNDPSIFITKSTDWAYEEEYRKTNYFGKETKLADGGTFVEFPPLEDIDQQNWPIHLIDVPASAIRKLIFGYRSSDETKARLRAALKQTPLKHVSCAQAKPNPRLFKMEQTPVSR